ncbi:hypothetical protein HOLleu_28978 [Holothuria leucospilota]|uniref:G-protein coupled receptors family 1 profile domain-containing protein n=1 Tax=Holothuria leucospilota TaxID=206669 RepID=A0A9Q1BMT1_HOLLE|nr:hypothetical protein HOLleu_28978 [Holothuria leucospilota]
MIWTAGGITNTQPKWKTERRSNHHHMLRATVYRIQITQRVRLYIWDLILERRFISIMNESYFIDSVDDKGQPEFSRPPKCAFWYKLLISDVDSFFYSYVILTVVVTGFLTNSFFWAILRTSSVPIGRVYNRFLIFISMMEVLHLATRLMEAIWMLISRFQILAIAAENTTGLFVILMLMYCLRALSLYSIIFTVCWLSINCSHDIPFFYNGNTSSLLEKLKDCRGYKSLTIILLLSLCIAAVTEIPVITIDGPYCVIFVQDNKNIYKQMYFQANREKLFHSMLRVIEALIPICFIAFILFQFVNMVLELKKSTTIRRGARVHLRQNHNGNEPTTGNKDQLLPSRPGAAHNDNCNQCATQSKGETNDIQLTFFYLTIPLTAQYFLLWSPYYIINSVNTSNPFTNLQISNIYVIWIFHSMKLLTSVFNPIFFIFANWKYHKNIILEGDRSRRITQETNV